MDVLQEDKSLAEGQIVSSQTITSKSRTVETTTYAIEQEGGTETHIEQKVSLIQLSCRSVLLIMIRINIAEWFFFKCEKH
jgi:hypothetical protein